jgi:hypothetical protein
MIWMVAKMQMCKIYAAPMVIKLKQSCSPQKRWWNCPTKNVTMAESSIRAMKFGIIILEKG